LQPKVGHCPAGYRQSGGKLPTEKRGGFLERVVARLSLSPRFTVAKPEAPKHQTVPRYKPIEDLADVADWRTY